MIETVEMIHSFGLLLLLSLCLPWLDLALRLNYFNCLNVSGTPRARVGARMRVIPNHNAIRKRRAPIPPEWGIQRRVTVSAVRDA